MEKYNFEKFTNSNGEIMVNVSTPGIIAKTTAEAVAAGTDRLAKKIFTFELVEFSELTKKEFTNDYIYFEASLKGEKAEDMYNQIEKFITE